MAIDDVDVDDGGLGVDAVVDEQTEGSEGEFDEIGCFEEKVEVGSFFRRV